MRLRSAKNSCMSSGTEEEEGVVPMGRRLAHFTPPVNENLSPLVYYEPLWGKDYGGRATRTR